MQTAAAKILDYPLNAWYVAAWDHEITRKPLARTIAGRPLALYRTEDGRPVALADACWHRLAPAVDGQARGHGRDPVPVPRHPLQRRRALHRRCRPRRRINPSAMVPSFPVVERYRYVWVWLGDPTLADPDLDPRHAPDDRPGLGGRRR